LSSSRRQSRHEAVPAAPAGPTSWTYLLRYRRPIGWGVVMLLATNAAFVGIPVTTGAVIRAFKTGHPGDVPMLVLWMAGFALITAVTRIGSRLYIFNAARAAEYELRSDLFGHLLTLSPSYYRNHPTGDVMSRLTNDVQTVRAMWGAGVLNLVNGLFAFATVVFMMIRVDPMLTLWAVLPFPTIYVVGQVMGKRIYRTSMGVQAELGALSSKLQEDLGGIQVIKSYGLEDLRRDAFVASSQRLLDRNMALTRVRGQLVPMLSALSVVGTLIVLWVGGHAVIDRDIDLGQLTEFMSYGTRLVWPTLALGWMLSLIKRGEASWNRLATLLATQPDIADGTGEALPASTAPARLEVKHLTIAIDDRKLLDDVSLTLEPGTVTAVVGRTGGGKSTLVDALCRLADIPVGTIFLDGRDLTTLPLASLRQTIGYAPQEAFLFSTTIADNIAMGYGGGTAVPKARAEELERVLGAAAAADLRDEPRVVEAARAAGLTRDLTAMPDGLATIVGERGITLSGGQRQRVALARALASAPRLLLLDDSLSSVDAETEQAILRNLRAVMSGRTAVLISHRVAAVKDADQLLVLDGGKIVERGTHAVLLAAGGVYAELYKTQLDPELAVAREAS
jgi:ATP-binding cassette subfamily B protein